MTRAYELTKAPTENFTCVCQVSQFGKIEPNNLFKCGEAKKDLRKIMSNEKIVLVAHLKVREDAVEETKKVALEIVADSRAEAGCLNYDVHQAIEDPSTFIWHETWKNKAAVEDHFETPFFKKFAAAVETLAVEPPQIILTKMISEQA
jgi:quinol monooxygenase YgiN